MPSYYQSSKFNKQQYHRKRERVHINEELRKKILANRRSAPDRISSNVGKEIARLRVVADPTQPKESWASLPELINPQ
jgi:hypothetical protein